jgi:hypothetical protein
LLVVLLCGTEQSRRSSRRIVGTVRIVALATLEKKLKEKGVSMNITLSLAPLVSLVAGILILAVPRMLNFIVAIYLIVIGLIGIFGGNLRL